MDGIGLHKDSLELDTNDKGGKLVMERGDGWWETRIWVKEYGKIGIGG